MGGLDNDEAMFGRMTISSRRDIHYEIDKDPVGEIERAAILSRRRPQAQHALTLFARRQTLLRLSSSSAGSPPDGGAAPGRTFRPAWWLLDYGESGFYRSVT